jgi:hypothetical protein
VVIAYALDPDAHLDARKPEWLDAELEGLVCFDSDRRKVRVSRSANRSRIGRGQAVVLE